MNAGRTRRSPGPRRTAPGKAAAVLACAVFAAAFLAEGCSRRRAVIAPVPSVLSEAEGYASLKLTQDGATARSKFSFVLEVARRARVEIQDPLGRSAAVILIDGEEGYFLLPSERAYWKSGAAEIMAKFLGTPLNLSEVAGLLCGRWSGSEPAGAAPAGWTLSRDEEGRWASGRKESLVFQVREFFPDSPVPRRVDFQTPAGRGSLSLLAMEFNRPLPAAAFDLGFAGRYASKSWEDIAKAWRHED